MNLFYKDNVAKDIIRYCKRAKIPIQDGMISVNKIKEIQEFIATKVRADKNQARNKEEIESCKIKNILNKIMSGIKVGSPIEKILHIALLNANLGKYLETQYKIGKYRVDFAIPKAQLVIEADGQEYHFENILQLERDQKRDKYLAKKGWRILHIDGTMIRRKTDECIEKIKKLIKPFITKVSENA